MATLSVPKEINEKTSYIKAFCKRLSELDPSIFDLDGRAALDAAEYAYQQAKHDAKEAAELWLDSH